MWLDMCLYNSVIWALFSPTDFAWTQIVLHTACYRNPIISTQNLLWQLKQISILLSLCDTALLQSVFMCTWCVPWLVWTMEGVHTKLFHHMHNMPMLRGYSLAVQGLCSLPPPLVCFLRYSRPETRVFTSGCSPLEESLDSFHCSFSSSIGLIYANLQNVSAVYWVPLSVTTISGMPCWAKFFFNFSMTVSALISRSSKNDAW